MRKEKYIVRADGNAGIGAGHLMRCLTIMEELARLLGEREKTSGEGISEEAIRGEFILFLCADAASAQLVEKKGFQALALHTDYRDMESELPMWEKLFAEGGRHILVDSYYVTEAYLDGLRAYGKVFLMDDMQEKHFPADAVINYNAFADRAVYEKLYAKEAVGKEAAAEKAAEKQAAGAGKGKTEHQISKGGFPGTELYIGSSYVPLRSQFQEVKYTPAQKVEDVLITTGGGDKDNIAGRILNRIYREDMRFHLVVGSLSPNYRELKALEERLKNVVIHHDVQNMAELMSACDAAITAGGSTVYELAAVGVPFICFSYAKNQEALVNYIGDKEIAGSAGAFHQKEEQTLRRLEELLAALDGSLSLREQWSRREREMIDCKGAARLAEAFL